MASAQRLNMAEAIRRRMASVGGAELEIPPRDPTRDPPAISETSLEEVAGRLRFVQKTKTVAEMNTAVKREIAQRHDRGRY